MPIAGLKMYKIECTKCSWSKDKVVYMEPALLTTIRESLFSRCPKCGSKVTCKHDKRVIF